MVSGSTGEVAARCARAAEAVDELAAAVRQLPPPSWTGPAAEELGQGVRHVVGLLDDGAEALGRAATAAGHVGAGAGGSTGPGEAR